MKRILVFVGTYWFFQGSCEQGSQDKNTSEVIEPQIPDSLIAEDYIKNNYSFYGAWKNIYDDYSNYEFENYYIYFKENDTGNNT